MKRCILILFLVITSAIFETQAQTDNEFWFAIPHASYKHGSTSANNINSNPNFGGLPAFFRIASTGPTSVKITVPARNLTLASFDLNSATPTYSFNMGNYVSSSARCKTKGTGPYLDDTISFKTFNNGIKIVAEGNPITVYYDLANSNNRDLFALKGKRALGKEFFVPIQTKWANVKLFSGTELDTASNGFDIITTEDNTTITIYPTADLNNGVLKGGSFTITIPFAGQTYSVLAKNYYKSVSFFSSQVTDISKDRLGGTRIVASKNIAVTNHDDSALPLNSGYDYLGDQLVPLEIIGKEYIVTSGQLLSSYSKNCDNYNKDIDPLNLCAVPTNRCPTCYNNATYPKTDLEWYYITTTKFTDSIIVNNGGVISKYYGIAGAQQIAIQTPTYLSVNPYSHVKSSAPVYIFQTTGFGDEPGGALIPKIDGCTGSQTVYFTSPASGDKLFLNIMAYDDARNNNIKITWPGCTTPITLSSTDFVRVGTTDWYVYSTTKNEFSSTVGGGKAIPNNVAVKVHTDYGRFHLGVIAGNTEGAKYGYFSNFSEERGSILAQKGVDNSLSQVEGCFGDTILLITSGGLNHNWTAKDLNTGLPMSNIYMSDRHAANPSVFPPPGYYEYRDTFSRPCWGDTFVTMQVRIYPKPISNFDVSNSYICTPTGTNPVVTIKNTSSGSNSSYLSWDYPVNDILPEPLFNITASELSHSYISNLGTTPNNYKIRLMVLNHLYPKCVSTMEKEIVVLPRIKAEYTSSSGSPVCDNTTINFTNACVGNVADTLYRWNFGDTTISTDKNPTHLFRNINSGTSITRKVKLVAISPFNCRDSFETNIIVHPYVKADYLINGAAQGCSPLDITFKNTSSGLGTINYNWDFNGAFPPYSTTSKNDITKPFSNNGAGDVTYNINLTVYNAIAPACQSSVTKQVSIFPKVNATFSPSLLAGCNPLPVNFQNTSGNITPVTYTWDFGDGTSESSTTTEDHAHTFDNITDGEISYQVKLTAVSNHLCQASEIRTITSYARMNPGFTIDKTRGCGGINAKFTNTTLGGTGIVSYIWNFGDVVETYSPSAQSNNFTHNYSASTLTNYNVFLTVNNGHAECDKSTASVPVTIYPGAQPIFSISPTGTGCTPLTVNFNNSTDITKTNFMRWEFGDGESDSNYNTSHTYINNTTNDDPKIAKLIAWSINGCKDTAYENIKVYSKVQANFNIANNNICTYEPVLISDASIGNVSKRYWQFENSPVVDSTKSLSFQSNFENYNLTPVSKKIQLVVKNNWYCPDTLIKYVTVNPHINAKITPAKFADCDSTIFSFTSDSNRTVTSWLWDFGDGASSANINPSHLYYHLESADKPFKVKLKTTSDYNCKAYDSVNITSYAYIDAKFAVDKSAACSGYPIAIDNLSPNGATRNSWYFGDGTTKLNLSNTDLNNTYNYNGPGDTNYNLKLVVRNNHDACKDSASQIITIYPKVFAKITPDITSGCDSLNVSFKNSSKNASLYFWAFGDGSSQISNDTVNKVNHVFFHLKPNSVPYWVKMTAVSDKLCQASDSVKITAYSYVKADFSIDKSKICSDFDIKFTNSSSPGSKEYYWDFIGDLENLESKSDLSFSKPFTNYSSKNDSFNITLISKNEFDCKDTIQKTVVIYPKVTAAFCTGGDSIKGCNPVTIRFLNKSSSFAKYFKWNFDDSTSSSFANDTHLFENISSEDREFNVVLTAESEYGCIGTSTKTITAYPYIEANFKLLNAAICSGDSINIIEDTPPGVVYREWDFDGNGQFDSNTKGTFWHKYINKGKDSVKYDIVMIVKDHAGCSATISSPVIIYPEIVSNFSFTQTDDCTPSTVQFQPDMQTANIETYNWSFGDGNTSNLFNPSHIYTNKSGSDHTYPVALTTVSKYKCKSTSQKDVLVRAYVEADFKIPDANICSGFATQVIDTSLGEVKNRVWRYSLGKFNLTSPSSLIHMFSTDNLSSDVVKGDLWLTVSNNHGCKDSIMRTVTIFPKVTADFNTVQISTGCSPYKLNFNNKTKNATDYNWYFGEGGTSKEKNPEHLFYNYTFRDTSYKVKLIAVSDFKCKDSITRDVVINHKPNALFSVEKTIDCSPFTVKFQNNTETTEAPGCFYTWDFDDGYPPTVFTKESVSHTFLNNTAEVKPYTISLKVGTNKNCLDTAKMIINVYPKVTARFDTVIPGCTPAERQLSSKNCEHAKFYLWKFENSEISKQDNPNYVFFNNGTSDKLIKIELVAESEYGCKDSVHHYIKVYPSPVVNFTVNPTLKYYPDATFKFINTTPKGPWIYDWDLNDGKQHLAEEDSFSYTYDKWNEYDVKLTATYGNCTGNKVQHLILKAPIPIAAFDSSVKACVPVTVFFKNNSKYGNSYLWEFGDGKSVTKKSEVQVSHTYTEPGIYNVKLTNTGDGGMDYAYHTIEVLPKPKVDFEVKPTEVMLPLDKIRCFNRTQGATRYLWRFGEEGEYGQDIDTMVNPTYKYSKIGTYTVKLVAWSAENCSDSSDNVVVQVTAPGVIEFPNAFMPNASGPSGGKFNTTENFVFYPYTEGVAVYHLEIFNRWGELLFISNDVSVGWDGYYKNQLCPQGVYVYKVKGKFLNGGSFTKAGDVTLLYRKGLN